MAKKFTSKEEDEEIKTMYATGLYTFETVAMAFSLSKSTIINIVKDYPYNSYKFKKAKQVNAKL